MNEYNPFALTNKVILVTGASSGIGRATAIECAKLGATMVVTGRNEERLRETLSSLDTQSRQKHRSVVADLTDGEQLGGLVAEAGQIDGLVLCSGMGLTLPFAFSTREKFDEIFETNFFSPIELLRQLYKKRRINKGGSVVMLSSLGGTQVFSGGNGIYGASKSALNTIMKFCAKEFAPRKIRVNSICPGMVDTPLIHRGTISDEQLREDAKHYPLQRYGQPEDIANAAVYLLSDASSWVTGQSMIVDGGLSIR